MRRLHIDPAVIVLVVLSAALIFMRLGTASFWEDEAETALVARTIWTHGIPQVTDGVNYFYQEQGKRVGYGNVWAWTPWLQFYFAALASKIFGNHEWSLRLPFALAGFLSIFFLYDIAKKLFDRHTAFISSLLLTTSVPFLLYVRQCRYYSLSVLGVLWGVDALLKLTETGKRRYLLWLFCALAFVFHSNYITWFGLMLAVFVFCFFQTMSGFRKPVLGTLVASVLFNLPWFWLFKPLHEKTRDFDWDIIWESIIFYTESFNHYIIPFLLLVLIPVLIWLIPKKTSVAGFSGNQKTWIRFFILLTLFTVFFSLFGPARVFRYLIAIIPIALLLFSILLMRLWNRSKIAAFLILVVFMFSNFFHVILYQPLAQLFPPAARHLKAKLNSPFASYLSELAHPHQGTIKRISDYLNAHAAPKDLIVATYGDLPLVFYAGRRVIGGLSYNSLEEARNADWVITRKVMVSDQDARVMVYLLDNLPWDRYEKIDLGQTDFPWDNIPEPNAHQFKSMEFNPDWQIQIYRKLNPLEPSLTPDVPKMFYFTPAQKAITGAAEFKRELTQYLLWLKERKPGGEA